jgi:hypothetical protein
MQRRKEIRAKPGVANWKGALGARGTQRRKEIRAKPGVANWKGVLCARWGYCEMGGNRDGAIWFGKCTGSEKHFAIFAG